ncbi:MAG TPA: prepilin-type N-terminal cleavage/methylation domain-containing protein [Gemmatimonadales bacterium]|jgi:prepilin-type N-terminal cleavage/methylation domain-containing protein|nr:prepilin-type N-terminal cleavage/methylation domain-containing protein [Gemmatimonadales bacterium]
MKPNVKQEQGFTLVEVIIAVLVLTIGLLGLVGSAALVTRMIGRGHRSGVQVAFSQRRIEMLRSTACTNQATGTDVLMRGGVPVDSLSWQFVNRGNSTWQVIMTSKYQTDRGKWRSEISETEISCII